MSEGPPNERRSRNAAGLFKKASPGAAGLFKRAEPWAETIKTILEMIVGAVVVIGVLVRVAPDLVQLRVPDEPDIFHIVAAGLAVVAAIELAYTLFTPGPDEVIDPLMLGLSSALLFQVSKIETFGWSQGVAVVLFVAALGGLFRIRDKFIGKPTTSDDEPPNSAAGPGPS